MRNAAQQIELGGPDREQPDPIANGRRELLTAEEVAELLGMGVDWVWEQARKGRIPHVKLGRFRRFRRQAILAWLEEMEQRETSR